MSDKISRDVCVMLERVPLVFIPPLLQCEHEAQVGALTQK